MRRQVHRKLATASLNKVLKTEQIKRLCFSGDKLKRTSSNYGKNKGIVSIIHKKKYINSRKQKLILNV